MFAELLLQCHMIQHLLLMMAVPPLLWLGAPTLPLPWVWTAATRVAVRAQPLSASTALQRLAHLTHPFVCLLAFTGSNVAWHVPGLKGTRPALWWHEVQHVCFLNTALLFWWPVVQPWPSPTAMAAVDDDPISLAR